MPLPQLALAALALLSLAAAAAGAAVAKESYSRWANYVFFLLPFRFWQLASGAVLYLWLHARTDGARPSMLAGAWPANLTSGVSALLFALSVAFNREDAGATVQLAWALAATAAVLLFLLAGAPLPGAPLPAVNWLLATPPLRYVGKLSYQLYLWHWPAILFTVRLAAVWHAQPAAARGAMLAAFAIGAGVALPLLSYHVVEAPLRAWRPSHHAAPIVVMLALMGATCAWVGALRGPLGVTIAMSTTRDLTPSCPESGALSAFFDYAADGRANPAIPTAFGRSLSGQGCACRFCDGVTPGAAHRPRYVTSDYSHSSGELSPNATSLCMSNACLTCSSLRLRCSRNIFPAAGM